MIQYRILKLIGKGTFGSVYDIKTLPNNKRHALKKISLYNLSSPKDKELILTELRVLKYNKCPYLLQLEEVFIERHSSICILTPLIKNGDLQQIIRKRLGKFFEEQIIWSYFIQMCLGIKYLHDHNISHRDIKSANIFVDEGDKIVIGDFGICKIFNPNEKLTNTNIGTPCYMSPECIGQEEYCKKIDIWSLGCVLFEIMTFYIPFTAKDIQMLKKKINKLQFTVDITKSKYSKSLINLVKKLLICNAKDRPTIDDILKLEEVVENKYLIPFTEKVSSIDNFKQKFKKIPRINIYDIRKYLINVVKNKSPLPKYGIKVSMEQIKVNSPVIKKNFSANFNKYKKEKEKKDVCVGEKKKLEKKISIRSQIDKFNSYGRRDVLSRDGIFPQSQQYNRPLMKRKSTSKLKLPPIKDKNI